jgi:hypothetical protein
MLPLAPSVAHPVPNKMSPETPRFPAFGVCKAIHSTSGLSRLLLVPANSRNALEALITY